MNIRDDFREIVEGWMLISGMADITDRIERAAEWAKQNGPLTPDEEATIKMMIESQIARGQGFDDDIGLSDDEELEEDCGLRDDGQCAMAGSEHCDFACPNRNSDLFAGNPGFRARAKIP